ncbi:MAG: LD-carboxypeptidase [Cytophagaceae bacterium]|nr:LD-carboxypeptidase [Cytophagaceae bacterium]
MSQTPPFLKKKDKVAIIATAKNFDPKTIQSAIKILKSWGLEPVEGEHLYKKHFQFAGSDAERANDFQQMLDDDSIKAILCVRGGYGTNRIIDQINFKKFYKKPKWVVGFSDITVLHNHIHKKNIPTVHALMPTQFAKQEYRSSIGTLKDALFGNQLKYIIKSNKLNRTGNTNAQVIGGNLSILCSLIGTPSDINTKGKILFIEEIDEYLYKLDRLIIQMKRAGKLNKLKGLIVGHMTDMKDNDVSFGKTANQIIADAVKDYKYPVCYNFPAGHEPQNFSLIFGKEATLKVGSEKVELKFK